MANNKFYTVEKEIYGKKYIAQFSGISAALKAIDNSYDDAGNTSIIKLAKYLLEHIIVEPRMKIADFGADMIGQETTKEIGGKEYTAKFNGLEVALKAADGNYIEGTNVTSTEKLAQYLFDNVVVEPKKLTIDDFDNLEDFNAVISFASEAMKGGSVMDEFNEVIAFAREVMQGNFRDTQNGKPTKTASKK